jgi:hypothetical protein
MTGNEPVIQKGPADFGRVDIEQDVHCGRAPFHPRHSVHTGMARFSVRVDGRKQFCDADGHPAAGQHAHTSCLHFILHKKANHADNDTHGSYTFGYPTHTEDSI